MFMQVPESSYTNCQEVVLENVVRAEETLIINNKLLSAMNECRFVLHSQR